MRLLSGPKTKRGKRVLEGREPKVHENDKTAILVKGGKTSEMVSNALHDVYQLKKPLTVHMKRVWHTSLQHPNSLVFGRLFDGHLLDMAELRITKYQPTSSFAAPKPILGSKPCIILEGEAFEKDEDMKRVGNLLIDFFKGPKLEAVRLQGLETIVIFSAQDSNIFMRVYRTVLLKSTTATPRVELRELGPFVDLQLERKRLASDSLFKAAMKQPKELRMKRRKNLSTDVMGNTLARIHVGRQEVDKVQTRKMKGLKKDKKKPADSTVEPTEED